MYIDELIQKGFIFFKRNQLDLALSCFTQAISESEKRHSLSSYPLALLLRARTHLNSHRFSDAEEDLDLFCSLPNPAPAQLALALYFRGYTRLYLTNTAAAEDDFSHFLGLATKKESRLIIDVLKTRIALYLSTQRQNEALQDTEQLLSNDNNPKTYFFCAKLYLKNKQPEEAIQLCTRGLAQKPNHALTLLRAQAYMAKQDLSAASTDLDAIVNADPFNITAQTLQAELLIQKKQYQEALQYINKLLTICQLLTDKQRQSFFIKSAVCYMHLNNYEEARKFISSAKALDPTNPELQASYQAIFQPSIKIRNTARTLFQCRNGTHLPDEMLILIASMVSSEEKPAYAQRIATQFFCRPQKTLDISQKPATPKP